MNGPLLIVSIAAVVLFASSVSAQSIEDAEAALAAGEVDDAVQLLEQLTAKNDAAAMRYLGLLYANGAGVVQDYAEAAALFQRASDLGDVEAMSELGTLYAAGFGVEQDYAAAAALYRSAAKMGHPRSTYILGTMIENGMLEGTREDMAAYYREAAEQDFVEAQTALGVIYQNGDGVEQNYAEARRWYKLAAAEGHGRALNNLGILYTKGLGVEQDYEKAVAYYQAAADKGVATAMTNLGVMYANGFGVPVDEEKATYWYRRGGQGGDDPTAISDAENLAGMPADDLERLAKAGDPNAQAALAKRYADGVGRPQDYVLAHQWANLAGSAGHPAAAALRASLEEKMTPGQINDAQARARKFREDKEAG